MPKRTSDTRPKQPRPKAGEPTPPFLSEKLIAQLQGAVSAAQRKRIPKPIDIGESRSAKTSIPVPV
jgi:hypothetical protein